MPVGLLFVIILQTPNAVMLWFAPKLTVEESEASRIAANAKSAIAIIAMCVREAGACAFLIDNYFFSCSISALSASI